MFCVAKSYIPSLLLVLATWRCIVGLHALCYLLMFYLLPVHACNLVTLVSAVVND